MQRKKPYESQINSKEISLEKKIVTRTIQNYSSNQNSPNIITFPPSQINSEINLNGQQYYKEIPHASNIKKFEIKENLQSQNKRHQKHKVYLSSRYNNSRPIENTPNLVDQISMNDELNNGYNLQSIRGKQSPNQGGDIFSNQKDTKNYNIRFIANPIFDPQQIPEQDSLNNNMKINTNESIKISSSAINSKYGAQYILIPQTKLSPIQKIEEGSPSFENKKLSEKKIRLSNYAANSNGNINQNMNNIESIYLNTSNLNNNLRRSSNPQDNRNTQGRIITDINSPSYNNDRIINQNSNSNTVSKKELKRIVKKFNKVYDPYRNEKGILLKQSQITLPGASDEIFSNRYRVLSKMNKLSNILLAKQKKEEENDSDRENIREININNIFDRARSRSKKGSQNKIMENGSNKKLRDSNIKEKTILRRQRIQKGGVVDLAQEEIKKNKFKIVKASAPKGGKTYMKMNSKYREKAAKIIQGWWRELKDIYDYKLAQIIKIQSIWKGRWVRKNIYDLLYLNYLYLSFCEKIEKIFTNKITKYALDKLILNHKYSLSNNKEDALKCIIFQADKRRITIIKKYWEIWINYVNNEKEKKNKGKTLLQIRADKDNKLSKLRNAFTIWKYNTKMDNIKNKYQRDKNTDDSNEREIKEEINLNGKKVIKITKIEEKERYITPLEQSDFIGKNKFKGLLQILEGANNYKKKQAFEASAPKIKKFLTKLAKIEKLKYLVKRKDKDIHDILKSVLNKWKSQAIILKSTKSDQNLKQRLEYDTLRTQIFLNKLENVRKERKKTILRKYLYKFIKNSNTPEKNKKYLDYYNDKNIEKEEEHTFKSNKYGKNSSQPYIRKLPNEKKDKIKYMNIMDSMEGCKKLEKYIWRNTYQFILNCFKDKIKEKMKVISIIKVVKIQEKIEKIVLKEYIDKWKKNTFKRKNNDIISRMFIKIIKIIIDNNTKKILSRRLNQWHNKVKILKGKNNTFIKSKNTYDFIEHIKKYIKIKYLSDFLDKLKQLRKENLINNSLLKIITRNETKYEKNQLKDALDKWKKNISASKIENLKGKLLLKIYDKYKDNKNKETLKKYLLRWENNTIFIDKITTIISEETTSIYSTKNKKDKIKIILKSIIRNINRKNNDNILRKYFNTWNKKVKEKKRNLSNNIKESLFHLKNINIINNAKYFMDKLVSKNKNTILKKILLKYGKPKNIILNYYFQLWLYKSQKCLQIEYSKIIQEFVRRKLKERNIINKWKKLYELLKNKLNIEIKLYILEQIKYYLKIKLLIQALKGNNKGNIFDKYFMKDFIKKLKEINEKNKLRNKLLNKFFNRKDNKERNNLIKNAFNKWRKAISDSKIEKLKGKLLLKIYDKYKDNKNKETLKKYLLRWENNTIFIDKITTIISEETTSIYSTKNKKDKIKIILKSIIRNINRKNNDNILRKYFNTWNKNIKDNNIILLRNFEYLLSNIFNNNKNRNGKDLIDNLKNIKKEKILRNVIIKYGKPKNVIINYYFQRWKYIIKKISIIENDRIIQQFCRKQLKNLIIDKKWFKLYSLLKSEIDKEEIFETIFYLKYFKGLSKLFKTLKNYNKKEIFDKINKQKKSEQIAAILIKIIKTFEQKNNEDLLKKYFNKWINYINKENKRINALCNMLEILEINNIKNGANYISDVFIINKLTKDINKVRALNFLKKIKNKGKKDNLYKNLSKNLNNTKSDFMNKNRQLITEKIFKIYFYKILTNLFNHLDEIQKIITEKNKKEFFNKLYNINISKAEYKYSKETNFNKEPNIHQGIQTLRKPRKNQEIKEDQKSNKVIVYRNLIPYFVKYLNKILKKRNYQIFEKLQYLNRADKFAKLLKIFQSKTNIPDKEDLVDSLKYYVYMKFSKISNSNKLYYLIRKSIIRKILKISKTTGDLCHLYHLVNITLTHRKISKDRWILKIIKRWRFITFVKKMAQKKMELMYKDLHVNYLEIAENVLKDTYLESRFLPDINADKYLFNFNDPYLIKGSNAYKGFKKQYVFEPLDAEIEKKIKEIEKVKTIEKYKEINKTYYNNNENGYYSYQKNKSDSKKYYEEENSEDFEKDESHEKASKTYKSEFRGNNYKNNIDKSPEKEHIKSDKKKYNFAKYPGSSSYYRFKDMNDE